MEVFFGLLLMIGIPAGLAFVIYSIAKSKGRNSVGWWFYGFFFFPIALVHVLLIKPQKLCKECGEPMPRAARICGMCGAEQWTK